jgi:hypothetical protein
MEHTGNERSGQPPTHRPARLTIGSPIRGFAMGIAPGAPLVLGGRVG